LSKIDSDNELDNNLEDEEEVDIQQSDHMDNEELNDESAEKAEADAKNAIAELRKYRQSLNPPDPPSITYDQYFEKSQENSGYLHLGRPLKLKNIKRKLKATLWMLEKSSLSSAQFPIDLKSILPLLDVLEIGFQGQHSKFVFFFNVL